MAFPRPVTTQQSQTPEPSIFDAFQQILSASTDSEYTRAEENFARIALQPGRVLERNENGHNFLMYLCSTKMRLDIFSESKTLDGDQITCRSGVVYANAVTQRAQRTGQVHQLYAMRDPYGKSIIDIAVERDSFEMLEYMAWFFRHHLEEYVFPGAASTDQTENSHIIKTLSVLKEQTSDENKQEVYKQIIWILNRRVQPLPFLRLDSVQIQRDLLVLLFGTREDYTPMELMAADCGTYFYDAQLIISYMIEFEALFNRYYQRKHGRLYPRLIEDEYKFVLIDGYEMPVPTDSFKGLKKEDKCSALQEFIMLFLRQIADWGNGYTAEQWIGHVPRDEAVARLLKGKGTFFTEIFLDIFIFHGKLIHMLDLVLISFLIRDKKLNVKLYDLIQYFLTTKNVKGTLLWDTILDNSNVFAVNLGDPFRLHSVMMRDGLQLMPSIATALIDTCCKRVNKYTRLLSQTLPGYDTEQFLVELVFKTISTITLPEEVRRRAAKLKETSRGVTSVTHYDELEYSVVTKRYHPDRFFKFNDASTNKRKRDEDEDKSSAKKSRGSVLKNPSRNSPSSSQ